MVKYAREPESGAAAQSACPPPHEPPARRARPPARASPQRPAAKEPLLPGASGGAGAAAAWAPRALRGASEDERRSRRGNAERATCAAPQRCLRSAAVAGGAFPRARMILYGAQSCNGY